MEWSGVVLANNKIGNVATLEIKIIVDFLSKNSLMSLYKANKKNQKGTK